MCNSECVVTDADRRRLGALLTTRADRAWGAPRWLTKLETILDEATPVAARVAPETLVTMNSTVELIDVSTEARKTVTLAYPQEVDLVDDGISVFEPFGVALIGSNVGDVVQCPSDKSRGMRVARILYQPEVAGAWHL